VSQRRAENCRKQELKHTHAKMPSLLDPIDVLFSAKTRNQIAMAGSAARGAHLATRQKIAFCCRP
jgi:hypothetical protein